ncbi:MAG: aminotransferase class I/II-fold pyridoxal phosphate-dependent enzyme [Halanaerobiales bacterium]
MNTYLNLTKEELLKLKNKVDKKYEKYKTQNLKLNMSRGKPCSEQLDLSEALYKNTKTFISESGIDCRNYGFLRGLPEVRELFAELIGINIEEIIIGNNSSLNMMHDTISRIFSHGTSESDTPWGKEKIVKFLCPSPGYDRHFKICEHFNIEMIAIPLNENGPDMDIIEDLVKKDDSIKGIWCVPKYSNPTGIIYSDEIVTRLSSMKTAANDFRIFWDNAYIVHHLTNRKLELKNILRSCEAQGYPDRVYMFGSTSKITYAGSGISFFASSTKNIDYMTDLMSKQTIGSNKINQLLHYRFLGSVEEILNHMEKHADILRPKFELVLDVLNKELAAKGIANWSKPEGGYFISLNVMKGCAREVVQLAKDVGVTLTDAGATYPYGNDPEDSNIRIAPSYPPLVDLEKAIKVVCTCIKKAAIEKVLKKMQ